MSNFIKAGIGFDTLPEGPIAQDWPWYNGIQPPIGSIELGAGNFGENGYTVNGTSTALQVANTYQFKSSGTFMRNNLSNNGKSMWAISAWIRVNSTNGFTNGVPAIGLTHASTPTPTALIPFITLRNTAANGLELSFMSTSGNVATAPYTFSIIPNEYYWVSVRFALNPNGQLRATYSVNNIELHSNIPVTLSADHLGAQVASRIMFVGSSYINYTVDDVVVEAVSGDDLDWPAGGGGTAPQNPSMSDLSIITPRHIKKVDLLSNGSVNEWTSSDPLKANYEAVQSDDDFVESVSEGEVDLYKMNIAPHAVNDCLGVIVQFSSSRYLNVDPVYKENETDIVRDSPIRTSGLRRVVSVHQTTSAGDPWTKADLADMEIGQRSR